MLPAWRAAGSAATTPWTITTPARAAFLRTVATRSACTWPAFRARAAVGAFRALARRARFALTTA